MKIKNKLKVKTREPVCKGCGHSLGWHGSKRKGTCFAQVGKCNCKKWIPWWNKQKIL